MSSLQTTYLQYLENLYFDRKAHCESEVDDFLKLIETMSGTNLFVEYSYFAIDYAQKKYVLLAGDVQKNTGHKLLDFFEGGQEFFIENIHRDDFKIYNSAMFNNVLVALKSTPQKEHLNLVFRHNFRIKGFNGQYISTIQKSKFITDAVTGIPRFSYGVLMPNGVPASDVRMHQVIHLFEKNGQDIQVREVVDSLYFPKPEDGLITKREKEILKWISEGFSIKQLAAKLYLTESTITNHRTNILRKTNTKNVAQLIKYAIENGII